MPAATRSVSLLFSDPTGSGMERAAGGARAGNGDRRRQPISTPTGSATCARASRSYRPTHAMQPPKSIQRHVRLVLRPHLRLRAPGARLRLARSATSRASHSSTAPTSRRCAPVIRGAGGAEPAPATGGPSPWDERLRELGGDRYPTAVVSVVAPDGFPMSARVPIETDEAAGRIRLAASLPVGMPLTAGRACLTAHSHAPDFKWQVNFQVRGNLVPDGRPAGRSCRAGSSAASSCRPRRVLARLPRQRPQDDALSPIAKHDLPSSAASGSPADPAPSAMRLLRQQHAEQLLLLRRAEVPVDVLDLGVRSRVRSWTAPAPDRTACSRRTARRS